jgi:Domain of unknown function (DUF4301)
MDFTDDDRRTLAAHGIPLEEAERQLAVLRGPPPRVRLERACTLGDGIERLVPTRVDHGGRLGGFVPASGAATRMFKDLLAWKGGEPTPAVQTFLAGAARFPFALPSGPPAAVVQAVLERYAELPKGLLPFHAGGITPFAEHLIEAEHLGASRVHFTVSHEHQAGFAALADGARVPVDLSTQSPATDTLALDADGAPFREDGQLLLRPAGHGALIGNLEASGGDLVYLKNIDNVVAAAHKGPTYTWIETLVARLVELERTVHALLADPAREAEARRFAEVTFARTGGTVASLLERPLRVAGMVPNTGETGGGPFWVAGAGKQIVETAQVEPGEPLLGTATHFNPVFLVCALRDRHGRPYRLADFVDPAAAIVTRKSSGGRELVALERPGLWNGAMAGWNTVFVEVPVEVFNPVKTVNDLLKPGHLG